MADKNVGLDAPRPRDSHQVPSLTKLKTVDPKDVEIDVNDKSPQPEPQPGPQDKKSKKSKKKKPKSADDGGAKKKSKKSKKSDKKKSKKEKHSNRDKEKKKKQAKEPENENLVNLGKNKLEYENKENYINQQAASVIEQHQKEKELLKELGKRIPIDTPNDQIKRVAEKSRAGPIPLRVKAANHMLLERKMFAMTLPSNVKAEFEVIKAKGVLRRQSRVQKHESKGVRFGVAETNEVEMKTAEWDDILIDGEKKGGCCCTII